MGTQCWSGCRLLADGLSVDVFTMFPLPASAVLVHRLVVRGQAGDEGGGGDAAAVPPESCLALLPARTPLQRQYLMVGCRLSIISSQDIYLG